MVNMNNAEISVCDKILNRKVSELAVEYYIVDTISNKKIISIVK